MVAESDILEPKRGVAFRRVGDQVVLVSLAQDVMLTLNPTGSSAFEALDGRRSVREVAAAVAREFEVGEDAALADVRAFLSTLAERGLIAGAGGAAP